MTVACASLVCCINYLAAAMILFSEVWLLVTLYIYTYDGALSGSAMSDSATMTLSLSKFSVHVTQVQRKHYTPLMICA